jgi:hypothetical protein
VIIIAIGRRGQGKTTLGYSIARKCESRVILDVRRTIPSPDPIGDLPRDEEKLKRQILDPNISEIVVRPVRHFEETNERLAVMMADLMLDPDGRIAIFLDEAGLIDFAPWDPFFRTADPVKVIMIVTAHRPQDVPARVRALADWFCLFRMTEPNDLAMVEKQCGSRVAEILPSLGPRVYVRYDAATVNDDRQIMTFSDPSAWYVAMHTPSFAQPFEIDGGKPTTKTGGLF